MTVTNRWIVLAAGVCIQVILGGIYAWSTFTPFLQAEYSIGKGKSGLIFGTTIISFTIIMIFAGRLLEKRGPRLTASIGAVLFVAGYLMAGNSSGAYPLLLAGIGIVAGAGIGFGYVCPLATGMKWFPHHKGLVTGVAVAGFGGGAVLLSTVAEFYLESGVDVLTFFRVYGLVTGAVLLVCAMLLSAPPAEKADRKPIGYKPLFSVPFAMLCIGIFAGTFSGLLIIGNLCPIVQESGLTRMQAVISISFFAAGNAAGRLSWGYLYDRLRYAAIPLSLLFFSVISVLLLIPLPVPLLLAGVALLGFGFGANFVVYAGSVSDYFGMESFSHIYPLVFLGYGVAGLISPAFGGMLADMTGSYQHALSIGIAVPAAVSLLVWLNRSVFRHKQTEDA
ncbi:MAG: MFS transporter [Spirochaetota bacterium]